MFYQDCVQYCFSVSDWKEAVRIVGKPLLHHGIIEERYIDAMIQTVLELGSYIVIAPSIALPHASPSSGAIKTGFSILKLEEPAFFGEDDLGGAKLIIAIACANNDEHMKMLQAIAEVLMNEEKVAYLMETNGPHDIYKIFKEWIDKS